MQSFDLVRGPLVRTQLVRLAEREHLFLIAMHQTLIDGRSSGVLADELAALHGGIRRRQAVAAPPPARQFADFAAWQRQWRSRPDVAAQLAYWRAQLSAPLPPATLATMRSRRAAEDLRTAQADLAIPARLAEGLRQLSLTEGATLFMGGSLPA